MANKFGKVKNNIGEVAKAEAVKAQRITLENVLPENLISDPKNREDITYTADIEYSINEVGFADPLEVTDFGVEAGKYMILSGHRRFEAGKKCGIEVYPCVVRHFNNESEIRNYNQLMNIARNEAQNPLLYFNRYLMAVEYLDSIGFSGSEGEKDKIVATRLGRSVQQASRFKALTKVVDKVLDLIREEKVGVSSVIPLAPLTEAEQTDIYNIFLEVMKDGSELTRPLVKQIVDAYKGGARTWGEVMGAIGSSMPNNGNTLDDNMNPPIESEENGSDSDKENGSDESNDEESGSDEDEDKDGGDNNSDEQKELKRGKEILGCVGKLDKLLSDNFSFKDDESSIVAIRTMMNLVGELINNCNNVAIETTEGGWDCFMACKKEVKDLMETLNS